jgi:NAD(P)-dependent dehydrogenase (short-subunit alcohol dehydrogenase family)
VTTAAAYGRLADKVAIVTGAGCVGEGWGNGRAAAVLFAREGASVFAVDRDESALATTIAQMDDSRERVHTHVADVTDPAAVAEMVDACAERLGRIDILINNVGGSHPGGATEISEADWAAQLELNLTTTYLGCRYVIPVMQKQRSGAIVNTASTSGIRFTGAAHVAYSAAKAGIIQLSRVTAVQYAPDGIRVNTVVPGLLHTPMVEKRLADQRAGGDVERLLRDRQARIPLPLEGDGRDTAHAALFLASDDARFITGTEIVIDGGMSARAG